MRPGVAVSIVGHVGAVMMTMLAWQAHTTLTPQVGSVVPVEIVDIAPESNVRALSDVNTPEGEEQADETHEAEPQPAPAPTPTPPPPQRRQQNDTFDLDATARMLNHDSAAGQRRTQGAAADRNQQGAGLGTAEAASLRDRINAVGRAHLRRCWRMPIDLPDPERLIVTVQFDLNRNGTLNGQPRVTNPRNYTFDPYMRVAAEAAMRAVRQCDPFPFGDDPLLRDHYELWRQTEVVFDPSHF